MKLHVCAAVLFAVASPAFAQLAGPRLNSLFGDDKRGETLTASTAPPTQVGSVYVIGGKQLENTGYSSAIDALSQLPGVFVQRTNAFGRADANIRGFGSNGQQIAVMVDGRPEKMALYGCTVTQTLPLNNVERIEVVEGPASALYGSGSIGGAVNIVTRGARSPFEGDVDLSYGSYGTQRERVRVGAVNGSNDFFAAAERLTSTGYTNNSAYEGNDYTVEYGRKLGDSGSVRLRNKFYSGTQDNTAPVDKPAASPTWFDYRRGALDLSGAYESGDITYSGRIFNGYGHHSFSDGWLSDDKTYGALFTGVWKSDGGAFAKLGAEHYWLEATRLGASAGAWAKQEYAAYTDGQLPVGNFLLVNGALRFTGDKTNSPVWMPTAGVAVKPYNQLELYTTASRGLRFPQIFELYSFPISNADLKPETVWGYEAGARYSPAEKVSLHAAAWMSEGNNLIQFAGGKFNNAGDFLFRGVQGDAKVKLTDELSLNGAYTFLDPGVKTTGRPGHTATGGLLFDDGDWGVSAECLYAGKYFGGEAFSN